MQWRIIRAGNYCVQQKIYVRKSHKLDHEGFWEERPPRNVFQSKILQAVLCGRDFIAHEACIRVLSKLHVDQNLPQLLLLVLSYETKVTSSRIQSPIILINERSHLWLELFLMEQMNTTSPESGLPMKTPEAAPQMGNSQYFYQVNVIQMQNPPQNPSPAKPAHQRNKSTGTLIPQVAKYRTKLCKHYSQKGACPLGDRCSFAHGKVQVRMIKDPVPEEAINQAPYNNYKTNLCINFTQKGQCRYMENCTFAHGQHELRNPYDPIQPAMQMQQQYAQWFMAQQMQLNPFQIPPQLYTQNSAPFQQQLPTQSQVMSGAMSVPMYQQQNFQMPNQFDFQNQVNAGLQGLMVEQEQNQQQPSQ